MVIVGDLCVYVVITMYLCVADFFFFLELFFAVSIVGDFCCVRRYYNVFMFCLF